MIDYKSATRFIQLFSNNCNPQNEGHDGSPRFYLNKLKETILDELNHELVENENISNENAIVIWNEIKNTLDAATPTQFEAFIDNLKQWRLVMLFYHRHLVHS